MGREVGYQQQTLQTPNPIARYAHRQRYRLSLQRGVEGVGQDGVVLDYGCGKGDFLNALAAARPDLTLLGYDPESGHEAEHYTPVDKLDAVDAGSVDLFCCFETLEHLYDDEIDRFLAEVARVAGSPGQVLISVPVIGGPPLLLKELNRMVLFRRASDYSWGELARASLLGRAAPRPDNVRASHKGFDFRALAARLAQELEILDTSFSPFRRLPWWLNSQAFLLARVR